MFICDNEKENWEPGDEAKQQVDAAECKNRTPVYCYVHMQAHFTPYIARVASYSEPALIGRTAREGCLDRVKGTLGQLVAILDKT